ncbi:MAG: dual specificity protein phosphatase family protein [Cyanobacteria bacterium P01_C01_bin.118]
MTEHFLSATNPWWVIPKHLAGSCKPAAADLVIFRKKGISAIVSLLSDDSNLDLYQQNSIPHIWVPVLGGNAPNLGQLNQIQTFVNTQNQLGNAVVIHCSSGRRRTGTVLTALLVQQGQSYESALNIVLTINPNIELREPQINFLKSLS